MIDDVKVDLIRLCRYWCSDDLLLLKWWLYAFIYHTMILLDVSGIRLL